MKFVTNRLDYNNISDIVKSTKKIKSKKSLDDDYEYENDILP